MSDATTTTRQELNWNVLTGPWLEAMDLDAVPHTCSPLEALNQAHTIRCIAAASPLDLFAAHRFLLTLLYWKAGAAGGVNPLRESLLNGVLPRAVLNAIEAEAHRFWVFDEEAPFLQDPSVRDIRRNKSAGSFFSEFASGTNIAHFHHGDDKKMRLCMGCATIGIVRVVPWSQSGGSGITPAVHNAPPVVALASGGNLAVTLGLNLVPLMVEAGEPRWSGHFMPSDKDQPVPYLEAFTWNPRRIHLRSLEPAQVCWRCGKTGITVVGQIVYEKNDETKKRANKQPFEWQDPAAFYTADEPYTTRKSTREEVAAHGRDLAWLLSQEDAQKSIVVEANPDHHGWVLVVPCTNPANNKTFDHRQIELTSFSADAIRAELPVVAPASRPSGLDGWSEPQKTFRVEGAARFVRAGARLLTPADWAALSAAAYRDMHDSPAAFDVLSGLLWGLRRRGIYLPRNVAWLTLKLMAAVPVRARVLRPSAPFNPIHSLPKRQLAERRKEKPAPSPYPVSFPRGNRLEAELRGALDRNMRRRRPEPIDWASLCYGLDRLVD